MEEEKKLPRVQYCYSYKLIMVTALLDKDNSHVAKKGDSDSLFSYLIMTHWLSRSIIMFLYILSASA